LIPLAHISPPSRKPVRRKLPGARDSDDEGDSADQNNDYISPGDAVGVVGNRALDTYAPPEVEKLVWGRIAGYIFISLPRMVSDVFIDIHLL
jgi:hypothetical protein